MSVETCDRIGVDQQQGGSNYPFVGDIDDEALAVILDFYLAYEDRYGSYQLPFRIDWLYGFGSESASAPGGTPTPVNVLELRVKDAADVTVFDTTTATEFYQQAWGTDKEIVEWRDEDHICRVVRCTSC